MPSGDPTESAPYFRRNAGDPISIMEAKLDIAVNRLSQAKLDNVLEVAASQLDLIRSYYSLALYQARRSFRWALVAAGVGLAFFLASIIVLLFQHPSEVAVASIISGALVEVISGINFYLYNKTSAQLADFLTRLDLTQRYLLSNSICESLDGDFKQKARLRVIGIIAGLKDIRDIEDIQGLQATLKKEGLQ
jgi:hypothetical protein